MVDYKPIRKITEVSVEEITKAIAYSYSFREASRKLGITTSNEIIKARTAELGLDTSHFRFSHGGKRGLNPKLLVGDNALVTLAPAYMLARLIEAGMVQNECGLCHQGPEWRGKPLMMRLNFVNGDNNDRRMENLQVLCPNCYSQNRATINTTRAKTRQSYRLKNYKKLAQEEGWDVK